MELTGSISKIEFRQPKNSRSILPRRSIKQVFIVVFAFSILGTKSNLFSQVLKYNTKVEVKPNNLKTLVEVVILVPNSDYDWLSNISITHAADEQIKVEVGEVLNSKGETVFKLKSKDIKTRNALSNNTMFQDRLVTEFNLFSASYPYKIRYVYSTSSSEYLNVIRWWPLIYFSIQTTSAELEIKVPHEIDVNVKSYRDILYARDSTARHVIHKWNVENIQYHHGESFATPWQEIIPSVHVVQKDFFYGVKGSFETWQNYGKWQYHLNEGRGYLPSSEIDHVRELVGAEQDTLKIIDLLYNYLQENTRYINVSIDIGGMQTYPSSYVVQNRYGDCKALTNFMQSLLKEFQIPSFYTKIYADENPVKVDDEFPSQQFNHVILGVPLGADTLWLENTSSDFPSGYLGTFTQNRWGLAVTENGGKLVRTPPLKMEDTKVVDSMYVKVQQDGVAQVEATIKLKGREFERWISIIKQKTPKQQEEYLNELIPFERYDLKNWNAKVVNRTTVEVSYSIHANQMIRSLGNEKVFRLPDWDFPDFEKPSLRNNPLRIPYPISRRQVIEYEFDGEAELPENVSINTESIRYNLNFTPGTNGLLLNRDYSIPSFELGREKYPEFYSTIEDIKRYENLPVLFKTQ